MGTGALTLSVQGTFLGTETRGSFVQVSSLSMPIHPNSKWRMGILCATCRLRPKSLPPYGDITGRDGVDYCEGHNNYEAMTGLYVPEEYSVLVSVKR